jgi:hypothetical protein
MTRTYRGFIVRRSPPKSATNFCESFTYCFGRNVVALNLAMNTTNRHRSRHGRLFLVLMFVFTSIVPGSLHAFAMAGSQAGSGGGHHAMMGHVSGDHPAVADHQSQNVSADFGQKSIPADPDTGIDQCCPATCFVALCSFDVVTADRFVPKSFQVEPTAEFIVIVMALPERPPRA